MTFLKYENQVIAMLPPQVWPSAWLRVSKSVHRRWLAICSLSLATVAPATAEVVRYDFASLGTSYSAALFFDDPLVGLAVTNARIYLEVEALPGSDAAGFLTDLLLPIQPATPEADRVLILSGEELGWSGSGRFSSFEETTGFNVTFIPRRYGSATLV